MTSLPFLAVTMAMLIESSMATAGPVRRVELSLPGFWGLVSRVSPRWLPSRRAPVLRVVASI